MKIKTIFQFFNLYLSINNKLFIYNEKFIVKLTYIKSCSRNSFFFEIIRINYLIRKIEVDKSYIFKAD